MNDPIWEEFRRTWLRFTIGDRILSVVPNETGSGGPFLPEAEGPVHVLTAWNPQGIAADEQSNVAANQMLKSALRAYSITHCWPASGISLDVASGSERWQEEGFGVCGLTRNEAVRLASRFDQRAIFEWSQAPNGLILIACDNSTIEARKWASEFSSID